MVVSVVIVTHNSRSFLDSCLESLQRQSLFDRTEVILIDNASSDGSLDLVTGAYPWVLAAANRRNLGFAAAVNVGLRRASARYCVLLNPDTIVRPDAIARMLDVMAATPDAGIVAPKLINEDGSLQYSCRRFYTWRVLALRRTPLGRLFRDSRVVGEHLMADFDHEETRAVDWVLGACMCLRREAMDQVGLLDERFFLYFEDVDLCHRMRRHGWRVLYHPPAVVVHEHRRESARGLLNRAQREHFASMVKYVAKWRGLRPGPGAGAEPF